MFITSIANYAISVNEGYCDLHRNKNYICMVHLIRMMVDACFESYRLLLTDEKEKFLRYYFSDRDTNKCKYNGIQITTNILKGKIEEEYQGMGKVYEFSNRFIHPSNFYIKDYSPENRVEITHKEDCILPDYTSLYLKREVQWVDSIMRILNEVLFDILNKLKDYIEPPIQLSHKINLDTKKVEPNPNYKGEETNGHKKNQAKPD